MRRLLKWTIRLALILGALLATAWFSRNAIVRAIAEHRIGDDTGLRVHIGRVSTGISAGSCTIENIKVYNQPEFGGGLFLDIPKLHVQIDPAGLTRRKLRLTRMDLELAEIAVVRNRSGETNIFSIARDIEERQRKKRQRRGDDDDFEFDGIEKLNLSLGKARFIDLGNPALNTEVALNMKNQSFPDVRTEADVYGMLFMVWLRSGGKFSIGPSDLARDYLERKKDELEESFRNAARQAAERSRQELNPSQPAE